MKPEPPPLCPCCGKALFLKGSIEQRCMVAICLTDKCRAGEIVATGDTVTKAIEQFIAKAKEEK